MEQVRQPQERLADVLPFTKPHIEQIAGQRVNLDRCSDDELVQMCDSARERMQEARDDLMVVLDYRNTRAKS